MSTRDEGVSLRLAATLLALGLCACTGSEVGGTGFDSVGEGGESTDGESDSAGAEEGETDDGGEGETGDSSGDSAGETSGDTEGDSAEDTEGDTAEDTEGDTAEDTEGESDGGACQEFSDALAPVAPSVLMVLDRSGSMMDGQFDLEDPDKTRWQALYESVEGLVMQDNFNDYIQFGAKTFSTKGWGSCGVSPGVDVDFSLGNGANILANLPPAESEVNGGTPTQAALEISLDYMREHEAEGSKVLLLVTDGGIGCAEDEDAALAEIVADLNVALEVDQIVTYVVGIAPKYNSAKTQLEAMAAAGGTGDYIEASDAASLSDAIDSVVASSYTDSCYLQLDNPPPFPDLVEVEVDGSYWDQVGDCSEGDGWTWANDEMTRILLCNSACDALIETQEANVEFHCDAG